MLPNEWGMERWNISKYDLPLEATASIYTTIYNTIYNTLLVTSCCVLYGASLVMSRLHLVLHSLASPDGNSSRPPAGTFLCLALLRAFKQRQQGLYVRHSACKA